MDTLYHGSKHPNLTVIKPSRHNVVDGKAVVFATPDIRFALSMIYGTGDQIAVGYTVNTKTGEEEMYLDEIQLDALALLNASGYLLDAPGYLYEVSADGFYQDKRLIRVEMIRDTEITVIQATKIENVLQEMKKYDISITKYDDVPEAMRLRNMDIDQPEQPNAPDRFKPYSK